MYESKQQPLLPRAKFNRRLLEHLGVAIALVVASLALGMLGYSMFEHQAPIDAFLNTAMLLGGMGPVGEFTSWQGKLFAGFYALYAGLVFLVSAALVFTPILHRLLHTFHLDD
jgi:hypothetical protein